MTYSETLKKSLCIFAFMNILFFFYIKLYKNCHYGKDKALKNGDWL